MDQRAESVWEPLVDSEEVSWDALTLAFADPEREGDYQRAFRRFRYGRDRRALIILVGIWLGAFALSLASLGSEDLSWQGALLIAVMALTVVLCLTLLSRLLASREGLHALAATVLLGTLLTDHIVVLLLVSVNTSNLVLFYSTPAWGAVYAVLLRAPQLLSAAALVLFACCTVAVMEARGVLSLVDVDDSQDSSSNVHIKVVSSLWIVIAGAIFAARNSEVDSRRAFVFQERLGAENVKLQIAVEPFSVSSLAQAFARPSMLAAPRFSASLALPVSSSDQAGGQQGGHPLAQWAIPIEDLEFRQKLGEGASGTVHKARHRGRTVAVKEIRISADEKMLKDAASELKVLSQLHHPYVVNLFGICVTRSRLLVVTEFCPHELWKCVVSGKIHEVPFSRVARELAEACHCIHQAGVAHRDLKPENVLLTRNLHVKLCDFGLALSGRSPGQAHAQSYTRCVGTPGYMANELFEAEDDAAVDPKRADVFSFGMVLYAVFARQRPFDGLPLARLLRRVLRGDRPPMSDAWPERLCDLIERCWTDTPELRPTFAQIRDELADREWDAINFIGVPVPRPPASTGSASEAVDRLRTFTWASSSSDVVAGASGGSGVAL